MKSDTVSTREEFSNYLSFRPKGGLMPNPISPRIITRRSEKFKFGKYKGWTVKEVLEEDSGYILWCDQNSVISFSEKILDDAEDKYYQEEYGTMP